MNIVSLKQAIISLLGNPLVQIVPFWIFSWGLMLMGGNSLIGWLKSLKGMKWSPREDTPDSHLQKAGTPSMGGLGILGAATFSWIAALTLLLGLSYLTIDIISLGLTPTLGHFFFLIIPLLCVLAHGTLGFADDLSKARGKGGLTSKAKFTGQCVLAIVFLLPLPFLVRGLPSSLTANWLQFDWWTGLICALVLIGTSNAVNITDGVDGLATSLSVQVALFFGVGSFLFLIPPSLFVVKVFYANICFVWLALGGACLGFLAFNKYPAKVFMGDTGSLALGAALGLAAIFTGTVFLLPFIGFIFYVEMFSVIAQVAYFKYTKKRTGEGKRIFRRAPLHHHFELGGWSERQIVIAFWLVNALTAFLGLLLWMVGIIPRFP